MKMDYSLAFCPVVSGREPLQDLTDQELALLGTKTTQKRIDDFVAGRLAAKKAVRSFLSLADHIEPSILRTTEGEEAGKPYVHFDEGAVCRLPFDSTLHVSITHADKQAYAAVSRTRIGIDNVTIEPYSDAFMKEVFQKDELQAWADWIGVKTVHPLAICSAFAAKEAFLKWMGVGLRLSLLHLQITPVRLKQAEQPSDFFLKQFQAVCRYCKDNCGQTNEWMLNGYFSIEAGQVIIMLLGE